MALFYHLDDEGHEWGPFTSGQLTGLLNRGCLNAKSQIRIDGDPAWHTYYQVPRNADSVPSDSDDMHHALDRGQQIALELERHLLKKNVNVEPGADTGPPPVAIDTSFSEDYGLLYSGFFAHESRLTGTELVFSGLQERKAHVFLPDTVALASHLGATANALAESFLAWLLEVHEKTASAGHYESARFDSPMALTAEVGGEALSIYVLRFERAMRYKQRNEPFRHCEATAYFGQRITRVAYSYPRFLETLEHDRTLSFALSAIILSAATKPATAGDT